MRFHTDSQAKVSEIEHKCSEFYNRNDNFFKSKGYEKDDARLVMGSIPIAGLIYNSESEILENLSQYNRIQGVYLI